METKEITKALMGWLDKDYRTSKQIINWLAFMKVEGITSDRAFREYVNQYRKEEHEYYLLGDENGYLFTRDSELYRKSLNKKMGNVLSSLRNVRSEFERIGNKSQLAIIDNFINEQETIENQVRIVEGVN